MRAALFQEAGKPLTIERVADPTPAADDVVIAVGRAGICGSDLHITQYGAAPAGTILGHEFAGEIVALGSAVAGEWRVGDRVTALPLHACGHCEACDQDLPALCPSGIFTGTSPLRQGAYAEFVSARASMLQRLPAGVSIDEGGMIEPLAVGYHTVEMGALARGAAVLVLGAGPIGAAVALFARLRGARHVVVSERTRVRRERALEIGATAVVDPLSENVAERFHAIAGCRPDVVFECVGVAGVLQQAIELAGVRGRVVVAGACFSEDRIMPIVALGKELHVQFTQCYSERDFADVINLIAKGEAKVAPLHTATIGFSRLPDMFEALRTAADQCKVLIDPRLA